MGLRGEAAIVGYFELPPERLNKAAPAPFVLEQWAELVAAALDDAGLPAAVVNGIATSHLAESQIFVPSTVAEYLGLGARFAELVDLGGASAAAMVWRAAAIELGICDAVLCALPARYITPSSDKKPRPNSRSRRETWGRTDPTARWRRGTRRSTATTSGRWPRSSSTPGERRPHRRRGLERQVAHRRGRAGQPSDRQRRPGRTGPKPPGVDQGVRGARAVQDPHLCRGPAAHPIAAAADTAFAMAGLAREEMGMVSIYDCSTITVLLSLEDAGFCPKGTGMRFVAEHDLTFRGDFPLNAAGGQLGFGQAGLAGGMHHVCDAARQIMGRAGAAQVADCNRAFVSGNGGILSEQTTLVLQAD